MKQRLLIIDGMYFFQRVLGQLNMGDSVNNLDTLEEQNEFKSASANSLWNLWKSFSPENNDINLIDNIIFVTDYGSWRKDIQAFRPYFIPETSEQVIGYKEQRKAKKDESPINYDNFYQLTNEITQQLIDDNFIVFKINKLEGDDNLLLLSNKLAENTDTFSVIFGTDSDLNQVVKDNVILFRNIRSKEAPNGEYVINLNLYRKVFEQDAMNALLSNQFDNDYYENLFSRQISNNAKIKRELNRGISIASPFKTALVKSVAGDKKDNIFSLISWKSTTGTRNYVITEKYIQKALDKHGYKLTEENCQKILNSKDAIVNLLLALREVTKQKDVDLKELLNHLKHNLKINVLSVNNIPEEYRIKFNKTFDYYKEQILNEKLDVEKLKKLYYHYNKNNSILGTSIPTSIPTSISTSISTELQNIIEL